MGTFDGIRNLMIGVALVLAGSTAQADFSAADVYREAASAVVVIFGFDSRGNGSSGTGSVVTRDGLVLTNNHVIYDPKTKGTYANIRVFFKPKHITGDVKHDLREPYAVRVVSRDPRLDLALLQVLGVPKNLSLLRLGDSESVEIGSPVAAIGHPGGGGLWTLTTGTISSARKDRQRDIFQTDTAINPGNSGGPLLDADAHLVGVNTFVRRVNAQGLPLEGLNYSLRSALARRWMASQGVEVPIAGSTRPRSAPAPAAREPEPERRRPEVSPVPQREAAPASVPPAAQDQPHEFTGPSGEKMYGVPDHDFDLMGAHKAVYEAAVKHANDAFDELDSQF